MGLLNDITTSVRGMPTPPIYQACGCIGPQRGQPVCPCQMRALGIIVKNGRYVQPERDLGPARADADWLSIKAAQGGPA